MDRRSILRLEKDWPIVGRGGDYGRGMRKFEGKAPICNFHGSDGLQNKHEIKCILYIPHGWLFNNLKYRSFIRLRKKEAQLVVPGLISLLTWMLTSNNSLYSKYSHWANLPWDLPSEEPHNLHAYVVFSSRGQSNYECFGLFKAHLMSFVNNSMLYSHSHNFQLGIIRALI